MLVSQQRNYLLGLCKLKIEQSRGSAAFSGCKNERQNATDLENLWQHDVGRELSTFGM